MFWFFFFFSNSIFVLIELLAFSPFNLILNLFYQIGCLKSHSINQNRHTLFFLVHPFPRTVALHSHCKFPFFLLYQLANNIFEYLDIIYFNHEGYWFLLFMSLCYI